MKRQIRFLLLLVSVLCLVSAAIAASQRAALTAVRQVKDGILLEMDGTVVFRHSTLPNPHRVIVDVLQTTQTMQPELLPDQHVIINLQQGALQRVRVGQMGNNLRIVFDLTTSLRYQVTRVGGGLLLSFVGNKPVALPRPVPATPKMPDAITLSTVLPVSAANLRDTPISVPVEAATPDAQPVQVVAASAPALQTIMAAPIEPQGNAPKDGKRNFTIGMKYEAQQEWELAAQYFSIAVAVEPTNPEYKLHALRAQQQASIALAQKGDLLAQQGKYAAAARAYRLAFSYDSTHEQAGNKAAQMVKLQMSPVGNAQYDARTGNILAAGLEISAPQRKPSSDLLQVINFQNTSLRQLIEILARNLGLNVLFDDSFKEEPKFRIQLQDVTAAATLDLILLQSRHQFELVNPRTILIYSDNPANRQRFEQLLIKTFYLGSADANEVRGLVQQMLGAQRQVAVIKPLNALVVRDSPANLKLTQELIDSIDKNRAEVVVDVDIYEVSRSTSLEIGNQITVNPTSLATTAVGADGKAVNVAGGTTASLSNLGGIGRSGIGGLAGTAISPVLGGVGTLIGLPPTTLSLLQSKGHSRLLASTQIHALDGEQNQTKVGRAVPIRLGSTYVPGVVGQTPSLTNGGGGYNGAFDSIQYRDVGLVIDVTPTVSNEGYVQLKMRLESTSVEASGADATLTPSFTQRSLSTLARVMDGKTAVVAGIKQENKGESRAGLPILSMIPVLGRFVSTPRQNSSLSDIVITVTPHVLRAPVLKQEDHLAKFGGTSMGGVTLTIEEVVSKMQTGKPPQRRELIPAPREVIAAENRNSTNPPPLTAAKAVAEPAPLPVALMPEETAPAFTTTQASAPPTAAKDAATNSTVPPLVDLHLLPANIETQTGETFFVMASVAGPAKINEAHLWVHFDATALQFVGARHGGLLGETTNLQYDLQSNQVTLHLQPRETMEAGVEARGQLVLLEFKALQSGASAVSIQTTKTALKSAGGTIIPFDVSGTQVTVVQRLQLSRQ